VIALVSLFAIQDAFMREKTKDRGKIVFTPWSLGWILPGIDAIEHRPVFW
jgi:hypothetical protein